jgi:hypothetical protein
MQYFATLPKIIHTDNTGTSRIFTNLIARASILPSLLKNPMLYYKYDIQEGDTPEIIAHKYYGDTYRYWIVLYANQLLDAQWDWPMSSGVFNKYITEKYPAINPYTTLHHYEKVITTTDSNSSLTTVETVVIDEDTYNMLIESNETYSLPESTVSVATTKKIVNLYDYELNLNESKRNINILNSSYVEQFETEFKKLMSK